jgi:cobalt-zinc-cadmium efflux system outer membrane protein
MKHSRVFWLAGALILPVHAAEPESFADLPPTSQVLQVLKAHPGVLGAQSGIRYETANRDRLAAGPYEFVVRLGAAQRRDPMRDFAEWDVALERSLRLPDKARLDAQLGEHGVEQAKLVLGDAMHEAARALLRSWFAVQRARIAGRDARSQVELLARQAEAVRRRTQAGDAPRMELNLAEAALAQAQAAVALALGREQSARAELTRMYPGIAVSETAVPSMPRAPVHPLAYWMERILEHNHELAVARGETLRATLRATRASADRTPDPTIGIRHGSERAGAERVTGVFVSIPFPGQARTAASHGAQAQAEGAAQREAHVVRRLSAEIESAYRAALGAFETWQRSAAAAQGLARNADLVARGYALGESDLAGVLAAQRYSAESQALASSAGLEAAELGYRLMLDAHLLWPFDDGDALQAGRAAEQGGATWRGTDPRRRD